jgi:hypothetical protein
VPAIARSSSRMINEDTVDEVMDEVMDDEVSYRIAFLVTQACIDYQLRCDSTCLNIPSERRIEESEADAMVRLPELCDFPDELIHIFLM